MTYRLIERLAATICIGDGGMGTLLQARGLRPGLPPESLLLSDPDIVTDVHREYVDAGADFITTNTFGGNRIKLKEFDLEAHTERINGSAVHAARKAAGSETLVAGSLGPTGTLLRPMGTATMGELEDIYLEQAGYLSEAGVDFLIIETMGDLGELIAAARACFRTQLPYIVSMTFDENCRSLGGTTPEILAASLEPYFPAAIGTNCGTGPNDMLPVVRRLLAATHLPVMAQPNAGLPQFIEGETCFRMPPEAFAVETAQCAAAGAAILGGCCGTTPDHIRFLKRTIQSMNRGITVRSPVSHVRFTSRIGMAAAGQDLPFCVIGERINPTGRRKLSREIAAGDLSQARLDANSQGDAGASLVDLNVGVPGIDEPAMMAAMVEEIQAVVPHLPLSIDSNDVAAIHSGLVHVVGRPLINSVNGDPEKMERLLPLVKKFGANFIALAMDEAGIPEDDAARLRIIQRIIDAAERLGISRNRILVDCLVFTVGSQPQQVQYTLKAIHRVQKELGCATVLGVSNVSFGLPRRTVISSTFLAMAMQMGLSAGIINPLSDRMMENLRAAELLLNRDTGAMKYVKLMEKIGEQSALTQVKSPPKSQTVHLDTKPKDDPVTAAVISGLKNDIEKLLQAEMDRGTAADIILKDRLIPAIQKVGDRYGNGEIYLPQLIMAGEAMRTAVNFLKPVMKRAGQSGLHDTPVVLGTVEGDIHDIGKNIVAVVLENLGFRVIDLGKNIPADSFQDAVRMNNAQLVGLSALMTTTLPSMKRIVDDLRTNFPGVKIMVGGAVVTRSFSEDIGAHGYARDAIDAGDLACRLANLT